MTVTVGVGVQPADMALFTGADQGPRLLVVSGGSPQAWVMDPGSSRVTSFRLDGVEPLDLALHPRHSPRDRPDVPAHREPHEYVGPYEQRRGG